MRALPAFFLVLFSATAFCQISGNQQKALNSVVDYANQSGEEVTAVVKSIIDYYPRINQKQSWGAPRYSCPVQLDDYYLNNALSLSKTLPPTVIPPLSTSLNALREAAVKLDSRCKALDTYHKLEDYKQDNYAKAVLLINEMQLLVADYIKARKRLETEVVSAYKRLSGGAQSPYHKSEEMLFNAMMQEKKLLDLWNYNINESVHTGWPFEELEKSILQTDATLQSLKKYKPVLQYPASSMWSSFQGSLADVLSNKRSALDGYNFEAKKSDKHSNDAYLGLINYVNGTLVSEYNMFIQYAQQNNFHGLKAMNFVPSFEIRTNEKNVDVQVKRFKDTPHKPLDVASVKAPITKPFYSALSNYIDLINEMWSQTRRLHGSLVSFNSSASYYKTLASFEKRGAMSFRYEDFHVPLSHYQKAVADSKVLSEPIARALNDQAEVLINILKEMDGLSASLEIETRERRYEKDQLNRVYEILERQKELFDTWDERKELLYLDVRNVFDSYAPMKETDSWFISGKALQELTDFDREGVMKAKFFYKKDPSIKISTDEIDTKLREVIANEYSNMKGIQRIGRNNGLCPYNPYEDLPVSSKSLSEALKKIKPSSASRFQHPYYSVVYHYNDVVDDYNKFCELSKDVLLLKTVKQPELFIVQYPSPPVAENQNAAVTANEPQAKVVPALQVSQKEEPTTAPSQSVMPSVSEPEKEKEQPVKIIEKTKIVEKTKVFHDTIYIEKRDTVYISQPGEDLRSMEGYAINNMVLLLDVSGSMNSPEKLPLLKKSVLDLLSMMRQEDKVSIIAFSGKPKVLLEATSFKDENKIRKAINDLKPSGKTDGNAGVRLAYKVADGNYIRGGNNRIILATDGQFALNEETRQVIGNFSKEDIFLTIFNFGQGMGSSRALEQLAILGKGNYRYISKSNVDLQLIGEAKAKRAK